MATREQYISKFKTLSEATRFEDRVLDGGSNLPRCAKAVMAGHEPTEEYWSFLIGQVETSDETPMFLTVDA
jgi:hypothetical protein